MAQITSAIAAKQLRKLNEQHDALLAMEKKAKNFTAAIQEDVESVRPAYDFQATQDALVEIEEKIRKRGFEQLLRQMDKEEQIANLREIYADVMDYGDLELEKERLEGERDTVGEKYRQEIEKNARIAQNQDEYKKREVELAEEYNRVEAEVKAAEAEIQKRQSCGRRIEGLIAALEEAGEDFTESLWGSMVEKVTVFEDGLVFMLTSGEEVKVAPC